MTHCDYCHKEIKAPDPVVGIPHIRHTELRLHLGCIEPFKAKLDKRALFTMRIYGIKDDGI